MMKKLTFILFLFTLALGVNAQSLTDGSKPMIGGKYNYSITMENAANAGVWTLISATDGDVSSNITVTDKQNIVIDYTGLTDGNYTLRFVETAGGCASVRELPITLASNTFNVIVANTTTLGCNPESGNVHVQGDTQDLIFTYDITRENVTTGTWAFDLLNEPTVEGAAYTTAPVITVSTGTLTGTSVTAVAGDKVTVTVTYKALPIDLDVTNMLSVTASTVTEGTTVVTANDLGSKVGGTINGLPNTSNITFK